MAKLPKTLKAILDIGIGKLDTSTINAGSIGVSDTPSDTLDTDKERTVLLERVIKATEPYGTSKQNSDSGILNYITKVSSAISASREENLQAIALIPEINKAASIVIPTICAPSDLRNSNVSITCDHPDIDNEKRSSISEVLEEYFNTELKLSSNLPKWIYESYYVSGAKVLLTIPASELDRLFNSKDMFIGTEAKIDSYVQGLESTSLYGIADSKNNKSSTGMESLVEELSTYVYELDGSDTPQNKRSYNLTASNKKEVISAINDMVSTESLSIADDADLIKIRAMYTKRAKNKTSKVISTKYKEATILTLNTPSDNDAHEGDPFHMELPSESVIPIYVPGTPFDHTGYFVLLDHNNNPVNSSDNRAQENDYINRNAKASTFENMYRAYGLGEFKASTSQNLVASTGAYGLYRKVIEHHLNDRLTKAGYVSSRVGGTNSVYRYMLARYLSGRKTKLLYIPKEFITYMCYDYNTNGTGRSKLEDIKFILAIKLALLTASTLTALNNSVNRQRLEITFMPNTTGHPLELMEHATREYINKNTFGFSLDPERIQNDMVRKGLTLKFNNLPNMSEYSVQQEANDRPMTNVDDSILQRIDDMLVSGLDVTPSMMNMLSEAEFSRSVAVSSLVFNRFISNKQDVTCEHLSNYIRTNVAFTKRIKDKIRNILGNEDKENDGTADVSSEEILSSVIMHIKANLPKADMAPNKAQLEELIALSAAVDGIIEKLLPDNLMSGDPDASDAIPILRSYYQRILINNYLDKSGVSDTISIPSTHDLNIENILTLHETIRNIGAAIKANRTVMAPGSNISEGADSSDISY